MNDKKILRKRRISHKEREVLVQEAKNKDIFAVAQQLGMKLQGNGKAEWEGHDSFWLDRKKNRFQWYGKGLWGDPVTLVSVIKFGARSVEDYKKNYRQSIAYLTNTEVPQFDSSKLPKSQPFKYRLKDDASMPLATDYLINERGLALETVQFFKEKGVLAQSVWRNKREDGSILTEPIVVFKHFDGNNKMIGGSVQGIEYHPELHTDHKSGHLKRVLKNSGGYSGLVVDIGQPRCLVVCEAPIDLLSYYELHKETLKDVKLLSSDGYKPHVLSRYVAEMYGKSNLSLSEKEKFLEKFDKLSQNMSGYPNNLITFAYDNDAAGRGFIEQFKAQYPHAKNYVAVELPPLEKEKTKADWNDHLRRKKEKQMEKQHWKEKRVEEISGQGLEGVIQNYEQIIKEQQASLQTLSEKFQTLVKQNTAIIDQLSQATAQKSGEDKGMYTLKSETKSLSFDYIPRLLHQTKEKLSEVKNHLKENIKVKSQKGLSITLENLKISEMLQGIKKSLEHLAQKVQHLETQLKVLSGQQVDKKEILLLPEPLQKAAEETAHTKNTEKSTSMKPQNKFEERLQKANENRHVVEEKMKLQPRPSETLSKHPKV